MTVTRRIAALFTARANQSLDPSHGQQLELAQQVRRGVADVTASRRRVERQRDELQRSAGKLEQQAQRALATGDEELAREYLARRGAALAQVGGLAGQAASLRAEEERLTLASHQLQARIDAFRSRKQTAEADVKETGANEAGQRARDRTGQLQARAGALDQLLASGALRDASSPDARDRLRPQPDAVATTGEVEVELTRIRAELAQAPNLAATPADPDHVPNVPLIQGE
jgi:phage shock protein A